MREDLTLFSSNTRPAFFRREDIVFCWCVLERCKNRRASLLVLFEYAAGVPNPCWKYFNNSRGNTLMPPAFGLYHPNPVLSSVSGSSPALVCPLENQRVCTKMIHGAIFPLPSSSRLLGRSLRDRHPPYKQQRCLPIPPAVHCTRSLEICIRASEHNRHEGISFFSETLFFGPSTQAG